MRSKLVFAPIALSILLLAGCLQAAPAPSAADPVRLHGASGPAPATPVPEGTYRFDSNLPQVLVDGPYKQLPFVHAFLKSKLDGVDIEVGFWRPDVPAGVKVPIIIDAGPYYFDDGSPMERQSGDLAFLSRNFIPWGYAVGAIAVRGTGLSGGCMDLMGRKEAADLDQAITWLAEQPWADGNAALFGKSYDGSTPWLAATTGNPHLKTIVPISGVPDLYGLMFRNGTSEIRGSILLNAIYYQMANPVNPLQGSPVVTTDQDTLTRVIMHMADGTACPDHVVGYQASLYSGVIGGRDPMGYWAERNMKPLVAKNYHGSVYLIQGLQDWNVDPGLNLPFGDDLNRSGMPVHYMLGQWGHSYPYDGASTSLNKRWDWAQILLNWFDYWLKGKTTVDLGPAAQVLQMVDGGLKWRYDDAWPPHDANWTRYHLSAGKKLTVDAGTTGSQVLVPQAVEKTPDQFRAFPVDLQGVASADFYLPVEDHDLIIAGLPRVHVTVTPSGPSGFLAAFLYDVDAKGVEKRIGQAGMNLFFADGTETMKAPLTPGAPLVAKMEIQPMDARVAAGHRLLLRVFQYRDDGSSSTDIQGRMPLLPQQPLTLSYGGSVVSYVDLPLVVRDDATYFTPPYPAS